MSLAEIVQGLLLGQLRTLRRELEAYPDERAIWQEVPGLPNSAGTLALHLSGNLQHYFGARLGGTGYVRDRPAEFSRRDLPRAALLAEVEAAADAVTRGLGRLRPEALNADYPEVVVGMRIRTDEYLVHLLTHCAFHLGQLDYHRRAATGDSAGVQPVNPKELSTARPETE